MDAAATARGANSAAAPWEIRLLLQLLLRLDGSGGSAVNGSGFVVDASFSGGVGVTGVWRTDLVLSVKPVLLLSLLLVPDCWPGFCETGGRGGRESGLTGALS